VDDLKSSLGDTAHTFLASVASIRVLLSSAQAELPERLGDWAQTASLLKQAEFEAIRLAVNLERMARGRAPLDVSTHRSVVPDLPGR
jgi:hypothetical protein